MLHRAAEIMTQAPAITGICLNSGHSSARMCFPGSLLPERKISPDSPDALTP